MFKKIQSLKDFNPFQDSYSICLWNAVCLLDTFLGGGRGEGRWRFVILNIITVVFSMGSSFTESLTGRELHESSMIGYKTSPFTL